MTPVDMAKALILADIVRACITLVLVGVGLVIYGVFFYKR